MTHVMSFFQTCDIKAEGGKRFLTLKKVQLDQAGEVSYQALNAVTTAMLTVKGKAALRKLPAFIFVVYLFCPLPVCAFVGFAWRRSYNGGKDSDGFALVNN